MLIELIAQQDNIIINMQGVNAKTDLSSKKLVEKKAKKVATTANKVELAGAKKTNNETAKLKMAKAAKKLAIKKKLLKTAADMKKVDD